MYAPTHEETMQVVKSSFRERGIAKLDRLDQSEIQTACSEASLTGKEVPKDERARAREGRRSQRSSMPADGMYLGDFKQGERIAQTGVGLQWSDTDKTVARRQLLRMPPDRAAGDRVREHRAVAEGLRKAARHTPRRL